MDYVVAALTAASDFENTTGKKARTVYFAKGERKEAEAQMASVMCMEVEPGQMISEFCGLALCVDLRMDPGMVRVDDEVVTGCR